MVTVKDIIDKNTWEKAVTNFPEANFLHSWNWGQFQKNLGKPVSRLGFYRASKLAGIMLSVVERAKRATYITVAGGPLMNFANDNLVQIFKASIINLAKIHRASFVRVRPQILNTQENRELFKSLSLRPAPMYLNAEYTHQLDLNQSTDQLLANMRKNTRSEINRAQKLAIAVTKSNSLNLLDSFYSLQLKTASRHNFVPFSNTFLKEQFKVFAADNQAAMYTARLKDKLLVQAIIMFYGLEADYHYSASTSASRKYPGSYALLWQAIKDAKNAGFKRFNLWGVAPPGNTQHRFHGVSVFKRGFRGRDVHYLPAHDLVIKPLPYSFDWLLESLRRKFRRV